MQTILAGAFRTVHQTAGVDYYDRSASGNYSPKAFWQCPTGINRIQFDFW